MLNRKQREIDALRRRVSELEDRLCPCGQHEWIDTGERRYENFTGLIGAGVDVITQYKCKVCGKTKWS